MLVGLCGRSGSGKGFVSRIFADLGIPSIDTDLVYRRLTSASDHPSECISELARAFGDKVVNKDNSLNRDEMRKIAFGSNRDNLTLLNTITHKHILRETLAQASELSKIGHRIVIIDAPLLYESGFDKMCSLNICVSADNESCIERITSRDCISREAALSRLNTQKSREDLESLSDIVINNGTDVKYGIYDQVKHCADALEKYYREQFVGDKLK